jgi:hypothetical protein
MDIAQHDNMIGSMNWVLLVYYIYIYVYKVDENYFLINKNLYELRFALWRLLYFIMDSHSEKIIFSLRNDNHIPIIKYIRSMLG